MLLISFFLPWLLFEANGAVFMSLTGREVAASSIITTASGDVLFRVAPLAYPGTNSRPACPGIGAGGLAAGICD